MFNTRLLSAVSLCTLLVLAFALAGCNEPIDEAIRQPVARTDDYSVNQNTMLTVPAATGVLANDSGEGRRAQTGSITTNQGGTVVMAADGGFTYTPLGLFAGKDVFAYRVINKAGYDIGAVEITVVPVLPFAIDDNYSTTLNTALNVPAATGVLANDTLNGATITAPALAPTAVPTTQGGSLLLNADGSFDYTPAAAFTGSDTFTYTLTNPQGADNATVTIEVRQAPTAANDPGYMMAPGATLTVPDGATDLLANDTLGFPAATLTSFGGGSAGGTVTTNTAGNTLTLGTGSLTVNANGGFTFTPDTGFGGNFTFSYRLTNAAGTSDGLVTINVDPAPNAVDDPSLTATSTVLLSVAAPGLMSNDALGLPAATIVSFGGGSMGGTVASNPAGSPVALGTGSITVNANGSVSFTSNTGFTGNFTFDYRLQNVAGSSDATVTIFVQLGPTAVADSYTTPINTAFSRATTDADDLLDNDMGVPAPTIASFGGGSAGGTVTSNLAGATATFGAGSLTVNANGSFTFTPDTGFTGNFTFQYRAQNAAGTSDATVTIAVTQAPTANPDPSYIATSAVLLVVPAGSGLLANNGVGFPAATVVNFGGGILGGVVTDNAAGATATFGAGSLLLRADGSFDFTSDNGFRGNFTFQYRIQNTVGTSDAAVTIEVRLAPAAVADGYSTPPGVPLSVAAGTGVLANDERGFPLATVTSFGGGDLGGTVTTNAAGATITPIPTFADGSITLNADGSFAFTPATGQTGSFAFNYRITNLLGTSDATLTISLNQAPSAVNDGPYNTLVGVTLTVPAGTGLLSNDTLGVPAAMLTSFGGGSLPGTVTSNAAGAGVAMAGGTLTVNADGSVSLTTPGIIGSYTFLYRLTNAGGTSDAIVTIEVRQSPTANDDGVYNLLINTTLSVATSAANDLLDNDTRGFPLANIASFGGGSLGGAVTDNAAGAGVAFAGGTLTINADGSFSVANPTVTGNFTVLYRLTNAAGSDDATVSIDVRQLPVANDDNPGALYTLTLGGTLTRGAGDLFNDHGAGADALGFPAATIVSFGPATGNETAAGAAGSTSGGTGLTVNADGSFTYTPVANGTHTFVYRLQNAAGNDTAIVTITVNQAPNAGDDPTGGIPGTSSPGSTPFHIAMNGSIASGTSPNLLGNDTLGFPAATLVSFGPATGAETTVASASNGTTAAGGTVRVFANGSFNYTPVNATFTGLDSFRYTLTNAGGSDVGIVSLAVGIRPAASNDTYAPVLIGNVSINTAASTNFSATTNDTGDQRVAALVSAANGTATVNANGTFTFNPTPGFEGAATITYSVSNGFGAAATNGVISLTVSGMIWFLDNSLVPAGDGRLSSPFNSLAGFTGGAADGAGDNIFVRRASATVYSGGITLLASQRLIGEGATTSLVVITGLTLPADSPALPATGGINPVINGGVTLASGNTLNGLNSGDGTTTGLISGTGFGTLTVSTVTINSNVGALSLTTGTVNGTFTSVTSTSGADGVFLDGVNGTLTINGGALSGSTGAAFLIQGSSGINVTCNANITGSGSNAAVAIQGGTSSVTFGGNVTQSNVNAECVRINSGHATGTVTFQTGTVSATNGVGLQFDNADGTYNFNGTTTLNGGDAGIDILNGSSGTFTFGTGVAITSPSFLSGAPFRVNASTCAITYSGAITQANNALMLDFQTHTTGTVTFQTGTLAASNGAGMAFAGCTSTYNLNGTNTLTNSARIDIGSVSTGTFNFSSNTSVTNPASFAFQCTSNANVTYSGSISDNTGPAINIDNHDGGTITFQTGNLTASGGVGVVVTNCSGGTVNFNQPLKTISTGASTGINLTNNTGATINFNGGGLQITTASGTGFNATGGGTVTVATGTNPNTISSSAGSALNITSTTIGAGNVTFRSISAGTAAGSAGNGISLDTTGATGRLIVTGTGAAGSGGTIRNKTGADQSRTSGIGIYLNSTLNPSFDRMQLNDFDNFAIRGNNVAGFSLTNSVVNGTNGTNENNFTGDSYGEGAIYFGNNGGASPNTDAGSGTFTFTSNTISGGRARNLSVVDAGTSGGDLRLNVSSVIFGLVQNISGANITLALETRGGGGTTAHATVTGSSFAGQPGDAMNFTGQQSTTMHVIVGGAGALANTIVNTHAFNNIGGCSITFATAGIMFFDARNNTMSGANGSAVTMFKASSNDGSTPRLEGNFDGNTIGTSGVAGSGSMTGNGIFVSAGGTGAIVLAVTNNIVQRYNGNFGFMADNTGGSYSVDLTMTGNTIRQPGAGAAGAVGLTNGSPSSGDTTNVFARILNNDFADGVAAGPDVYLGASGSAAGTHTFTLSGAAAADVASEAAIEAFIKNNNNLNGASAGTTVDAYVDAPVTFSAFKASASLPASPTAPTP